MSSGTATFRPATALRPGLIGLAVGAVLGALLGVTLTVVILANAPADGQRPTAGLTTFSSEIIRQHKLGEWSSFGAAARPFSSEMIRQHKLGEWSSFGAAARPFSSEMIRQHKLGEWSSVAPRP